NALPGHGTFTAGRRAQSPQLAVLVPDGAISPGFGSGHPQLPRAAAPGARVRRDGAVLRSPQGRGRATAGPRTATRRPANARRRRSLSGAAGAQRLAPGVGTSEERWEAHTCVER